MQSRKVGETKVSTEPHDDWTAHDVMECRLPCAVMPHRAAPSSLPKLLLLIRHGATEWSVSGQHTGRTDLELTDLGRRQAVSLAPVLAGWLGDDEPVVFTSPLRRAAETAALALPSASPTPVDALMEVDYGEFEGLRSDEILARSPGWDVFTGGCPGGERPDDVAARCDAFIDHACAAAPGGVVVAFTHGHLSRLLTARLLDLPAAAAGALWNDTASLAAINVHRGRLVLVGWNVTGTPD